MLPSDQDELPSHLPLWGLLVSRLHTVFAFTRPAVSEDMGQEVARWQQDVLKTLAAPDSDDTQVSQLVAINGF